MTQSNQHTQSERLTAAQFVRAELPTLILLALPFVILPIVWNDLPDEVPMHWNFAGEVDRWEAPGFNLFLVPIIAVGLYLFMLLIPRIDPKRSVTTFDKPMPAIRLVTTLVLTGVFLMTIATATKRVGASEMMRYLSVGLSVMFVLVGNYLTTVRPNYFIGLRTPWTLESESVWTATHRLTGRLWVAVGTVFVVAALAMPWESFRYIYFIGLGLAILIPVVYSFVLFRRELQ